MIETRALSPHLGVAVAVVGDNPGAAAASRCVEAPTWPGVMGDEAFR